MIYFFWFVFSILAGAIASSKGRSGFGFFLLSVFLSPLVGLIAAIAFPRLDSSDKNSEARARCPECQELVLNTAIKCKHCGAALEPEDNRTTLCKTCKRVTKIGTGQCAYCEEPL